MKEKILYKQTATGAIQEWRISASIKPPVINIRYGQHNGKLQSISEDVKTNKSGRNIVEQIKLRVKSRINKQIDKGYRQNIDDAIQYSQLGGSGHIKPMLAQVFKNIKNVSFKGALLQRKLDGNRMLVTKKDGVIHAYTRNGKPIHTLTHITDQMNWLEEGQTVDGEVYLHGVDLKDISSWMSKYQESTLDLNYHIYDIISDKSFINRYMDLINQHSGFGSKNIVIEPTWEYEINELSDLFDKVRLDGYEGLMLRLDGYGYEAGKRSKSLLKIKKRLDDEAKIIGIDVGKDGAAILRLEMPSGKEFSTLAPGSRDKKIYIANNPQEFIGRVVTYSYAYITEYGIPFHPVAERFRDYRF